MKNYALWQVILIMAGSLLWGCNDKESRKNDLLTEERRNELVAFYGERGLDNLMESSKTETFYVYSWEFEVLQQYRERVVNELEELPEDVAGHGGVALHAFIPGTSMTDKERWETNFFSFGFQIDILFNSMYTIDEQGRRDWCFRIEEKIVRGDTLKIGRFYKTHDQEVSPRLEHFQDGIYRVEQFLESAADAMQRVNLKKPRNTDSSDPPGHGPATLVVPVPTPKA